MDHLQTTRQPREVVNPRMGGEWLRFRIKKNQQTCRASSLEQGSKTFSSANANNQPWVTLQRHSAHDLLPERSQNGAHGRLLLRRGFMFSNIESRRSCRSAKMRLSDARVNKFRTRLQILVLTSRSDGKTPKLPSSWNLEVSYLLKGEFAAQQIRPHTE
jgi:hypothetical protein